MTVSVPDTLTIDNSENYIMSIRLRSGGLSFSGYNPLVGESFFYREAEFDRAVSYISSLKEFFFSHEFFAWTYKRIHVICVSSGYTLVPVDHFREKRKEQLLAFNFSQPEERCLTNHLDTQTELLFGIDEEVYEFCSRSLLHPVFIHYMIPLLSLWKKQGQLSLGRRMYAVLGRKQMDVVCYEQDNLLFSNSFQVEQASDLLYYILYVWKQVGLDQQRDRLFLFGETSIRAQLSESLRTYLQHIQPMEIPSEAYLLGSEVVKAPMDLMALLMAANGSITDYTK